MTAGSTQTLTASVSHLPGSVVYVWYVNGVSAGTGSTFAFGSGVNAGFYRIDVTAFTADGTQAGSATQNVQVTSRSTGLIGVGTPLNLSGTVSTLALSTVFPGLVGLTTDGTSLFAQSWNMWIISKVAIATGAVSVFAGSGVTGNTNGTGRSASFNYMIGCTCDGPDLYVADTENYEIRKIVIATGVVTTLAGSGSPGFADGTGSAASFYFPMGITTDGVNLYVSDFYEIRKVVIATGEVTTLAGSPSPGSADGTGALAGFWGLRDLTTDGQNLFVCDSQNNEIRKVVIATGAVTTLAGSTSSGSADGTGSLARFYGPAGITTDGTNLYVSDQGNYKIRKVVIATGGVTTLAGSGAVGGDDGVGSAATFGALYSLTTDGIHLYVADSGYNQPMSVQGRIRMIQ